MNLSRALAPTTSPNSRTRGADYFTKGAVVHFDPQPGFAYAVVRGSDDYVVRLEVQNRTVRGTCTCPFFSDRLEPCKHLWAVVLACDARTVLQLPDTARPADIRFEGIPLADDPGVEDDDEWASDDPEFVVPNQRRAESRSARTRGGNWRQALTTIAQKAQEQFEQQPAPPGQLLYVIDLAASQQSKSLVVHLLRQEQKRTGEWGTPRAARLTTNQIPSLGDDDRSILERLGGARPADASWAWGGPGADVPSPFHMKGTVAVDMLPVLCATGRCRLALSEIASVRPQDSPLEVLTWLDAPPFISDLTISRDEESASFVIDGALTSGDTRLPIASVLLLLDEGIALTRGQALRVAPGPSTPWMHQLLERGGLRVPTSQAERLRETLLASGAADVPGLPDELRTTVIEVVPIPHLTLHSPRHESSVLDAELTFAYADGPALAASSAPLAPTGDPRVMARRATDIERKATARLRGLGARTGWSGSERRQTLQLPGADMPRIVRLLVRDGWHVEADGRRYRLASTAPAFELRSGLDWFELRGGATFDDQQVPLPVLLDAIRKHQQTVALGDGTSGILPEEWLRDFAPFALGDVEGDHVRFKTSQVGLLDAMLAARPDVSWDERAAAARARLEALESIPPIDPPPGFTGTRRDYQRDALGWFHFLRELGFGGCLADDMGLGKTVVVLALLESRRLEREQQDQPARPSLVVVPRSVLFNWQQEAARFAPNLRVLDFSGTGRTERQHLIAASDLVLVTYGTLRRDASALSDVAFDYVILDEAQTIKNANTAGAKAARLLNGSHRLALSGTPVENRVADLWSLFEFLNPGLLSGATSFGMAFSADADADELRLLSRGLRPFILRRTKEQVASELPAKTEQTIVCDLEKPQRTLYNELRDHYRRTLLGNGATWQRSKIQVLEALLRLRQAACHPALVDPARVTEASAKLDLLIPRIIEATEEGHKVLVFSQFTSFLSLLRAQLNERKLTYEYLDGHTKDREARVARFQSDESCRLFLISLKAGGVGLNLTAADYVFILDPWWNPAAEAQAVDRTHRIGQTRNVFAYRLIARDTVEERVLELQQRKRELADAIITADNSVVRGLQREDLELLLS